MDCAGCTACCTVLQIDAIDKLMNTDCQYCTDSQCSIHNSKPQTCTDFECGYYQGKNIPEDLRPDKCGVIFIKKNDRIFSGILVKGTDITDIAKGQINSFVEQGYSVVLISTNGKKPQVIPAKDAKANTVYEDYKEALSGNV